MMGYDHYFADGNGRTARAIFYWSMLNQDYWLTEYITISRILKQAPSQYAGSFLLTEDDDGDLTYFLLHHARIVIRALNDLESYLQEKAQEVRQVKEALTSIPGEFNHRQLAVLELALREPSTAFTAQSHSMSHNVTGETARKDLTDLESRGLLNRSRSNKKYYWTAVADVAERVRIAAEAGLGVARP
jgi:Fic family protein